MFKKSFLLGLALALLVVFSISGSALADEVISEAPGVKGPLNAETPIIQSEEPPITPTAILDIDLPVRRYSQNDSKWSEEEMQTCGDTIGKSGCALTSTAMVFTYYGAKSKDPGQLNTCLGNNACPIVWSYAATNCSENKAKFKGKYSYKLSKLVEALEDGYPPLVEIYNPNTDRTHWVVVRKVYGKGTSETEFSVNDPWDGNFKRLSDVTAGDKYGQSIVIFSKR